MDMMRMWARTILLIAVLVAAMPVQSGYAGVVSIGGKAARELAEELAEQAGKRAGREFVETATVQLSRIAGKCGAESLDVIQKHGLVAYRVFLKAGDDAGPYLTRAIRVHGDEALRIAQTSAGRAMLREGSDAAIRVVARHGDAAIPLLRRYGDDGVRAFERLSPANGRRLIQLSEENMLKAESIQALMRPLRDHGDRAMQFIWKHKKVFVSIAVVAAFVADPEPYLNGVKHLLFDPVVGGVTEVFGKIVDSIRWNLWAGVLAMAIGLKFLFRRRSRLAKVLVQKEDGR